MTIPTYDPGLDLRSGCCEPEDCNSDGCRKLFAVGPCSTIIDPAVDGGYVKPEDMIFDVDTWCQIFQANSVQFNPNVTFKDKGYLGNCYPETKPGLPRPTISVDVDFCRSDDGHCLLQQMADDSCLIGWMCMYDRAEFVPNTSPTALPDIMYGVARVLAPSTNFAFDQDDNRNYTLQIHKYMWRFNTCMSASALLKMNEQFKGDVERTEKTVIKSEAA